MAHALMPPFSRSSSVERVSHQDVSDLFSSEAPLGYFAGDMSLCRYALNNPMDATDPMGLDRIELKPDGEPVKVAPGTRNAPSISATNLRHGSSVRWVIREKGLFGGGEIALTIGTATTSGNFRDTTTSYPIHLDSKFGGGTISLDLLKLAASKAQTLLPGKGLEEFSEHDRPEVIKTIIELVRHGVVTEDETPGAVKAVAWLKQQQIAGRRIVYGTPDDTKGSSIASQGHAAAEKMIGWTTFLIERDTATKWRDAWNAAFLGVTVKAADNADSFAKEKPDYFEMESLSKSRKSSPDPLRWNKLSMDQWDNVNQRREQLHEHGNTRAQAARATAGALHAALNGVNEVLMHCKVENGVAYFLMCEKKSNATLDFWETPKIDFIDPNEPRTEIPLTATWVMNRWLGLQSNMLWIEVPPRNK